MRAIETVNRVRNPRFEDDAAASLRIFLFGRGRVLVNERQVVFRGHPKMWALLAYLALRAGTAVDREEVAAALWPDVTDTAARSNLRRHVAYLGDAFAPFGGASWFARSATQIGLEPRSSLWVDTQAFLTASLDAGRLAEAASLYSGELLEGLDAPWVTPERERLCDRYLHVLDRLVTAERRNRNAAGALAYASEALRVDPYREDVVRTLMRLRFESGDRAGALREYERFAALVGEELAAEPAAETVRLAETLRVNEPAPPAARALPIESTSFVGRSAELTELHQLLADSRLITIAGAPGVGKTRLALRLAHEAGPRFPDGARFVDLATATQPELVERAVADAFEDRASVRGGPPVPLERRLRAKRLLIVLDNCEQAASACGAFAERLIRAVPGVCIVATSRVVLQAHSEAVFALEPLGPIDAQRLFLERARFARRELSANMLGASELDAIVRATDGLPLAVELCAARLRTLTLAQLVARMYRPLSLLGDDPGSGGGPARTLRASLESSYVLLEAQERQVFRRLAVFAGKPALDAVSAIVLESADDGVALRVLSRLVDHSLLVAPDVEAPELRYRMLESIKDFAREKLELEDDEDAVRTAHARHFGAKYAQQDEVLRGPRAHDYFDAIADDHDDVRVALERLIAQRCDPELGAKASLALSRFWFDRGHVHEGATWLEAAAAANELPAELRVRVLHGLATLVRNHGDYERAFELFGAALAGLRGTGDPVSIGKALATYANAARMTGRYQLAAAAATEAYDVFSTTGDPYLCGYALLTSGCVAFSGGDLPSARRFFHQALEAYRAASAEADIALALGNLGIVAFYEADLDAATLLCGDSAERACRLGNVYYEASASLTLARVAFARGDRERAVRTLQQTIEQARTIGDTELLIGCVEVAAWLLVDRDALRGATLAGSAQAARERYRAPRSPMESDEFGRLNAALGARLKDRAYAAAVSTGRSLSLDEAIARAAQPPAERVSAI